MMRKTMVLGLAVVQAVLGVQAVWAAEDSNLDTYTLDTVVVTANRYEKPDVATAASTEIVTEKKIKDSGATNAQEALSKVSGMISDSSRAGGGAVNPFSNSEVEIRGTSGTLVLVNGMPLNLGNRYQLNDIPAENIKKIEVVKGGGAVLYGSEAIGGVINIITKDKRENTVKIGFGNHGRQNHGVTVQAGKLGVGYDYTKWGSLDRTSDYNGKYNNTGNSENNSFNANYRFDDKWAVNLSHNEGRSSVGYFSAADVLLQNSNSKTREDYAQLLYNDGSLRGNIYYNYANINRDAFGSATSGINKKTTWSNTEEKNSVLGGELQKLWDVKAGKFLLGGDFKREFFNYNKDSDANSEDYYRHIFSIFGSWDKDLDAKNNLTLSTRGTWTAASPNSDNFYNMSSQVQYLHKLDESQSLYASAGQSFKMPTFKQIYGGSIGGSGTSIEANPDIKPQTGVHYELGWKKIAGSHNWKAALFNEYIEDNISAYTIGKTNSYQYNNEDLRNTGIEFSCAIDKGEGWNYNYGLTYQNPEVRSKSFDWEHKYGKVQLTGGVGYAKDKWRASLQANYLADRYMLLSSGAHEATKPYLLTSLNVTYAMDKRQEFNLTVDNLLDREDNMGHTGTYYYTAPVNFLLSYKYKF